MFALPESDLPPVTGATPLKDIIEQKVKDNVEAKTARFEKTLKLVSSLGLGVVIAFMAWQYISSENKISNAFIRDEFVKQSREQVAAQTQTALVLKDVVSALEKVSKESEFTRQDIGGKLDKVVEGQKDLTEAIKQSNQILQKQQQQAQQFPPLPQPPQ